MIVYDPAAYRSDGGSLREIARFQFPRQEERERLCLADYFRSVRLWATSTSSAFQIVTVGDAATRRFDTLAGERSSTAKRTSVMGSRSKQRKQRPSGCTAASAASWAYRPSRWEALLLGLRRLSRPRRSHARCSSCFPPSPR